MWDTSQFKQQVHHPDKSASGRANPCYSQETALIVNPEKQERERLRNFFLSSHYRILTASTSSEAIQLCRDYEGAIHLLVTEVDLPGISAWKLAETASKVRPGLVVLFLSATCVAEEPEQAFPTKQLPTTSTCLMKSQAILEITRALRLGPWSGARKEDSAPKVLEEAIT